MADIEKLEGKKRESKVFTEVLETQHATADGQPIEKRKQRRIYARYNGEKHAELLPGEIYVVESVNITNFSTDILLQGVADNDLDTMDFDFYCMQNGKLEQWDIIFDKKYEESLIF